MKQSPTLSVLKINNILFLPSSEFIGVLNEDKIHIILPDLPFNSSIKLLKFYQTMIYVATSNANQGVNAYLAKNKKSLKEMGFKWIRNFKSESKAIMWINESYLQNEKIFLY